MAGDVVDEVREQRPERGAADRPAVDEQHVGPVPDRPVGDLAGADVEEPVGFARNRSAAAVGGEASDIVGPPVSL